MQAMDPTPVGPAQSLPMEIQAHHGSLKRRSPNRASRSFCLFFPLKFEGNCCDWNYFQSRIGYMVYIKDCNPLE